jgi:hypothetical protein
MVGGGTQWMHSICVSQFPIYLFLGIKLLTILNYISLNYANPAIITKWYDHPCQSCAAAGQMCVCLHIVHPSTSNVFHTNSNCSYIKRYYYIFFTLVHSVVKFGHTWFLSYYYSMRDICIFPSLVSPITLCSHRLLLQPCM